MQIDAKIDEILEYIDSARTMPMSSSAIVNKSELTALIDELRGLLPADLQAADAVLAEREAILEEARYNAERMTADARAEQAKLIADHEITAEARTERIRLLDAAEEGAEAIRKGVDAHVDAKLAALEQAAQRLAETARTGRNELAAAQAYHQGGSAHQVDSIDDMAAHDRRAAVDNGAQDRLVGSDTRIDDRRFVPEATGVRAERRVSDRSA